jgi:DNA-binding transcriptional ArsR family regulator
MNVDSMANIATLVGAHGRIRMLNTLLDGNGHSASELAVAAEVSAQTASSHLSKLTAGGLITAEARGRQRLFRLKNADVAAAIEALCALAPSSGKDVVPELRFARTCYDHLAGVLSIAVRDELLKREVLRYRGAEFTLTPAGTRFLNTLGIDPAPLRGLRRAFTRTCLDWTERHHHLGGAVGAALLSRFLEKKWIARMRNTRTVRVTHEGERAFEHIFGLSCSALRSRAG